MLARLLHRGVYSAWRSLRSPTYCRPEQIDWLHLKFRGNNLYAKKFEYLTKLQSEGRLASFYESKPIQQLDDEQLFFLMNSNTSFTVTKQAQLQLMANLKSTYFKCLLLKQFRWIGQVEQNLIMLRFNQQVFEMQAYEIEFCLEIISDFTVEKDPLDANNLQKALLRYAELPQFAHSILLACGYVDDMGITLKKLMSRDLLEKWVKHNNNWQFRAIYYTYRLSEKLQFKIQAPFKKQLDQYMSKAIRKLQLNYFESNYVVFLQAYYPQYVDLLNILYFTPRAYSGYLRFYQSNPHLKVKKHKIPISVLQQVTHSLFREILHLRIMLQLDSALSLVKSSDQFFVYSLVPVTGLLRYFLEIKTRDIELEFKFEKIVQEKLKLSEFTPQVLEDYFLSQLIMLLSKLARERWFSVDFWRKAVRWIDQLVQYNTQNGVIEHRLSTCSALMYIVNIKTVKEKTREAVLQLVRQLLLKPPELDYSLYTFKELYGMAKVLTQGRIGDSQLWILIEHRLNYLFECRKNKYEVLPHQIEMLGRIAQQFSIMTKGSYRLWTKFNLILTNQIKKKLIQQAKQPKNCIHIYLKLTGQPI